MNLETVLKALQAIPSALAIVPAVASLIETGINALSTDDQAVAREAYDDLKADNDEGHARLQAKLEAAKNR